jgi:hypothetical protein
VPRAYTLRGGRNAVGLPRESERNEAETNGRAKIAHGRNPFVFENYLTLLLENCAADYRLQQTAITVNTPRDEKSTTRWRNRDYHQEIMAVERDE